MERHRHILSVQQFDKGFLLAELFPEADSMKRAVAEERRWSRDLMGKTLYNLFYLPTTRTGPSFETAMCRLGGNTQNAYRIHSFEQVAGRETLEDTIQMENGYFYDCIVLRHPDIGAAERAAAVSGVPIINAGEPRGEHPTQALLDAYTIWQKYGRIDGLRLALVGDLNRETVNSLVYLLAKFNDIHLDLVAPNGLAMKWELRNYLENSGVKFTTTSKLKDVVTGVNVVYMTRAQTKSFDYEEERSGNGSYKVDLELLTKMPKDSIVLHPMPRGNELPRELDDDSRIQIFTQAQNGLFVRMALLKMLLL